MVNSGFEQKRFEVILNGLEDLYFSKTDDKKVMASMDQMLPSIYSSMENNMDLVDININLNNVINSKLDWHRPRETFDLLLDANT